MLTLDFVLRTDNFFNSSGVLFIDGSFDGIYGTGTIINYGVQFSIKETMNAGASEFTSIEEAAQYYFDTLAEDQVTLLNDFILGLSAFELGQLRVVSPTTFDDLDNGSTNKAFTATEKTKLSGITVGATANSSDATLLARTNHTGTQAISTVTGLQTALDAKQATITAGGAIADGPTNAATNAATDAATDAATNAATNAPTNLNTISTLLGALTGEVNATNAKQNDLAAKYNDLATKCNASMTKYNAAATKYNDAADKLNTVSAKLNTLMAHLRTQGLQST